ncbi:MAG: hypothetical protein HZA31_05120 [Opitutae bacterium]|nr:hypothetical protein [Opitutae bacterium]
MSGRSFADLIADWASRTPEIAGVALIGSQTREGVDPIAGADAHSDWDFHVITSRPAMFADRAWTKALGVGEPRVYAARDGIVGRVTRVTAIFSEAEADFVVLPAGRMRLARLAVALGLHHRSRGLRRMLGDLSIVTRPGYRFLHGAGAWEAFYRRVIAEVADPRMEDEMAIRRAELFVADYVVVRRKLLRGELIAAQRVLHRALAEINFQLLHELRLRRGERSFPDVRRAERVVPAGELSAITVAALPTAEALSAALDKSAATCRELMRGLVGERWRWPEL